MEVRWHDRLESRSDGGTVYDQPMVFPERQGGQRRKGQQTRKAMRTLSDLDCDPQDPSSLWFFFVVLMGLLFLVVGAMFG